MDADETTPRDELIRELRALRERIAALESDPARLRETQKTESLGALTGRFAHDINNLLMAVLGNADVALARLGPEHPAHRNIQQISVAARRAADLTGQVLAYAAKSRLVTQELDLNAVIAEMSHLLKLSAHHAARPTYHLAARLPPVAADTSQVRQLLVNLITNAAEAIGDRPGSIGVSTAVRAVDAAFLASCAVGRENTPGVYVALEVADTGDGMDAATQARMFEPFFSARGGRGLGLAAVHSIVSAHGGALHVRSAPRAGTAVTVLLRPLAPQQEHDVQRQARPWPTASGPQPQRAPGRGQVLLVDDDASVREVAQLMLAQLGFAVHVAHDGEEARRTFAERHAELRLVLLDLVMPGARGDAVLAELRAIDAAVPVLLMSGHDVEEINQRLEGRGAAGFVQKPFTFEELRAAVTLALAG